MGCTNSSACNCFLGNVWINSTCPDLKTCTDTCALDGEDETGYKEKYGVEVDKLGMMNLTFVKRYQTEGANGTNVGNRVYLLEDDSHYKMFKLLNKEFTFTVDMSNMPCGLNGAVYFVEMDADGGIAKNPTNKAGAKYGTGYCDAQCPHDIKWIDGEANIIGWNKSKSDPNSGAGKYGTCCAELDIWEANKISTQMTVHSCSTQGPHRCEGVECGDNNGKTPGDPGDRFKGVCDKNGCDFNPYREGVHDFYGPGPQFKLDSTKPMKVVTQFITDDGTDTGKLKEMRRFYIQNNKTIYNPQPSYASVTPGNWTSISDDMCKVQMTNFSDRFDVFKDKGGIAGMGEAMARSMALVISLWDDHEVGMIWLDATDPYPIPAGSSGAPRGTCNQTSGNYTFVEKCAARPATPLPCPSPSCPAAPCQPLPSRPLAPLAITSSSFPQLFPAPRPPRPPRLCPSKRVSYPCSHLSFSTPPRVHGDSYGLFSDIRYGEIGTTTGPSAPPLPSPCPGGSLSACIAQCPTSDPAKYKACLQNCIAQCGHAAAVEEPQVTLFPGEHYGIPSSFNKK